MSISLWAVRLDRELTEPELAALWEGLPPERRDRLQRVRDAKKRWEPLCAYGLLRLALRKACGWRELPSMRYGDKGKPEFSRYPEVQFSISHTSGAAMVGISETPVGVDIERICPLNPRVQQRLASSGETAEHYYENWVCYEASIKRQGKGVSPHRDDREGQDARLIRLFPDYAAAVSGEGSVLQVQYISLEQLFSL